MSITSGLHRPKSEPHRRRLAVSGRRWHARAALGIRILDLIRTRGLATREDVERYGGSRSARA